MRALLVALLVLIAALAGCSGKKGDAEIHVECDDGTEIHEDDYEGVLDDNATKEDIESFLKTKCKVSGGSGSSSGSKTSTSSAPNVLPILVLNVTDTGGNATNVTMLNGNLTFDATGSMDPDGQISAIAISVQDSNTTRTKTLYDLATKTFKPATFKFDRPGIVNVSIAMVDDRAGFNNTLTKAYVNHPQTVVGGEIPGPAPTQNTDATHPCLGAAPATDGTGVGGTVVDAAYFKHAGFVLGPGATYVVATPSANTRITICDPSKAPISDEKQNVETTSTNTEDLPAPASTQGYGIGFYVTMARVQASANVVVHYEPRPAAAA